jgi:hypothetical protein
MKTPKLEKSKQFKLVEKKNHNDVHGIFLSKESGDKFLKETVPVYVSKSYYTDKTLTVDSFEII